MNIKNKYHRELKQNPELVAAAEAGDIGEVDDDDYQVGGEGFGIFLSFGWVAVMLWHRV